MNYITNACHSAQDYVQQFQPTLQGYYNQVGPKIESHLSKLPRNTGECIRTGFMIAAITTALCTFDAKAAMVHGVLTSVAIAIHALVTPLFMARGIFTQLSFSEEFARTFVALATTGVIAKAFGNTSVLRNLVFLSLLNAGVIAYEGLLRRNTNSTGIVLA